MKTVLLDCIKKEKPNSSAVAAYSIALGNGATKKEASKAASDAADGETDTSTVVKNQVKKLYAEHERLVDRFNNQRGSLTVKQYEEQSAAIMRKIEQLERKHGVFYKDMYLKASGYKK